MYGSVLLVVRPAKQIVFREGVVVVSFLGEFKGWQGVSLGGVILGNERLEPVVGNELFMHEFGHCLQSRQSGYLYLFRYGIPSGLSVLNNSSLHHRHWVEQDASLRAFEWFKDQQADFRWPGDISPLVPGYIIEPQRWWEFIPPVFPLIPLLLSILKKKPKQE